MTDKERIKELEAMISEYHNAYEGKKHRIYELEAKIELLQETDTNEWKRGAIKKIKDREAEIDKLKKSVEENQKLCSDKHDVMTECNTQKRKLEARNRELEKALKRWSKARNATNKCVDLLLSNGISEEAKKIMTEYELACESLEALDNHKEG